MTYRLVLSPRALRDLEKLRKSGNLASQKKVQTILHELMDHPLTGTGKPEKLKFREDTYSRRLSGKDRIIYSIHDTTVTVDVLQILGHYDDK